MKPLRFAAQLAFICNLCFLLCVIIQRTHNFIQQPDLSQLVIVLGWMVAPVQNLVANIWYAALLIARSPVRLPRWLALANLAILLLQLYIYLILPA
ncbi:MAG: hypothetical protein WAP48_03330 [Sediminibacterium sp.]